MALNMVTENVGVVLFGVECAIIGGDSLKCTRTIAARADSPRTYGLKGAKAGEMVELSRRLKGMALNGKPVELN